MYHTPNQNGIGKLTKKQKYYFPKIGDYVRVINRVEKTEIIYKVLSKPCSMFYNDNPVQYCEIIVYNDDKKYEIPKYFIRDKVGEKEFVTLLLSNKCPHGNFKHVKVEKLEDRELFLYLL